MTTKENPSEGNNTKLSLDEAGKMFDNLFLDQNKKELVVQLFQWMPWLLREQKVQEAICAAKNWLCDLKEVINT